MTQQPPAFPAKDFPDFFVIGAPKCGTTSLFSWLQKHPDTYLPVKEPNFFSHDILDVQDHPDALGPEAEYLARLCPPEAADKLTGEATPKYLYSDTALAALTAHADDIRLIVMLRNPVDLAMAMHAQNLRQGREREPDFARAWARGPAAAGDLLTDYRYWGRPGARLEKYMAAFPAERLRVLILEEDMGENAATTHAEILSFLGLAPHQLQSYAAENPRRSYRSARLQGLSRRARRAAYAVMARLGMRPGGTGVLKVLDRLNGNRPGKTQIPVELRQAVAADLSEDALHVAKLLGRSQLPWNDFDWSAAASDAATKK